MALMLGAFVGWTCEACKQNRDRSVQKLRDELADVQSKLAILLAATAPAPAGAPSTTSNADKPQSNSDQSTTQGSSYANALKTSLAPGAGMAQDRAGLSSQVRSRTDIASLVIGTVHDLNRRKLNVIVTGVPEGSEQSDIDNVNDLFDNYLWINPSEIKSMLRLGKSVGAGKYRKILVRMKTEQGAKSVLDAARFLHSSGDEYVALSVFINPDLSKEEAKLAYEKRGTRRQRGSNNNRAGAESQASTSLLNSSSTEVYPGQTYQIKSVIYRCTITRERGPTRI